MKDETNSNTNVARSLNNEGDFSGSQEQYREIIKTAIDGWVKDFQDGRIKVNTVDDLKKLIEIDLELQKNDF